ncbi:hypothetical protein HDU84_004533 [Entophlyctis sp. JEL0112]|nr:hypothetical protein HDU84_004533 [Entophlyctis sp. JEL0112]
MEPVESVAAGFADARIDELSGMADFHDKLVEHFKESESGYRGWVLLALIRGVDNVCDKLGSSLNTISIICGLLLSASIPLLLSPPTHIQNISPDSFQSAGYLFFVTAAIILHFTVIIFNSLIVNLLNTAARQADRLNILFNIHKFPTTSYALFTVGNVFLAAAIATSISVLYSTTVGVVMFLVIVFVCGTVMNLLNSFVFLKFGHVVHGWKKKEPRVLDMAMAELQRRAELDRKCFHGEVQ